MIGGTGVGTESQIGTTLHLRVRVALGFTVLGMVCLVLWRDGPNPFVLTQWNLTYGDGVLRRALVGSVFNALGGTTDTHIAATGLALAIVAVVALAWVLAELVVTGRRVHPTSLGVALVFAISPSGLPFLAANVGKFDAILMLLLAAVVVTGMHARGPRLVAVASMAAVLGVLVHEAAVVSLVPWLAGWCLLCQRRDASMIPTRRQLAPVVVMAVGVATAFVVTLHRPAIDPAALREVLEPRTGIAIPLVSEIPHLGPGENLQLVWDYLRMGGGFERLALDVLSIAPLLLMCVLALRRAGVRWSSLAMEERGVIAGALAPLLLVAFGTDFGRWCTFTAMLSTLTTLVLLRARDHDLSWSTPMTILAVVTLSFTLAAGGTTSHAFGLR